MNHEAESNALWPLLPKAVAVIVLIFGTLLGLTRPISETKAVSDSLRKKPRPMLTFDTIQDPLWKLQVCFLWLELTMMELV